VVQRYKLCVILAVGRRWLDKFIYQTLMKKNDELSEDMTDNHSHAGLCSALHLAVN